MNLPEFLGSKVSEDPQNFIDEVKKFFGVMQVTGTESVELVSYQLKDVLPMRVERSSSARVYELEAVFNVGPRVWAEVHPALQVEGDKLREMTKDNKKARIGKYEYSQQKLGSGSRSYFQQRSTAPALSSTSSPSPRFQQDQKGKASGSKSQESTSGNRSFPTCPKCGKNHLGECLAAKRGALGVASLAIGDTVSFVTPYIAVNFGVSPETLSEAFSVSTPVGDPFIARRVYRNCPVTVSQQFTSADLVVLEMVDFNIILGMNWLHSFYSLID
uniref:Gag-pol polyprotein n=1 Tax=Solanum tuberosum TaxID=4113 RepID=M1D864_SOLTU